VTVTATASTSVPVPHVYQAVYTDPEAGDFHRILQPGTYTVTCNAPGYTSTTIEGVVVNADTATVADCVMSQPVDLAVTAGAPASAATNGTINYEIGVTNGGPGVASNVQLTSATPAKTTFVSMGAPAGWSCSTPAAGEAGAVSCSAATLAVNATAGFTLAVKIGWCAGDGASIIASAAVSSSNDDAIVGNDTASASTTAIDDGGCDDGDACTTADSCASGSCVGTAVGPPAEVVHQQFVTKTSASWDPPSGSGGPAPKYDIARGTLGQWPAGAGASELCEQPQYEGCLVAIPDVPPADAGFWYLVRARNDCGIGTYGAASDGTPRDIAICP
jgi:uncharacterized repeat protein (TIGR01451 family)